MAAANRKTLEEAQCMHSGEAKQWIWLVHDHPKLVRGASLITQDHRKIARVARPSPGSRDTKAALTLFPKRGEAGAHFCCLGVIQFRNQVGGPSIGLRYLRSRTLSAGFNPRPMYLTREAPGIKQRSNYFAKHAVSLLFQLSHNSTPKTSAAFT